MPNMHVIDLAAGLASGSASFFSVTAATTLGAVASVFTAILASLIVWRQRRNAQESTEAVISSLRELEYAQERLAREQVSNINVNVERLAEDLQITSKGEVILGRNVARETEQLIREISHSLNTPLGQIELTVARFMETAERTSPSPSLLDAGAKARQNIQVCRAVLAAYRELTSIALVAPQWDVDDLQSTLQATADTFLSQEGKSSDGVRADIRLPKSITGYSNYFILSLLLPLVQNAVEAAPPNTVISSWAEHSDSFYKLNVT